MNRFDQNTIEVIRAEYSRIVEQGCDINDFGNAVGHALGEELKDRNVARSFVRGVDHGLSLVDGSHDNPKLREWGLSLRDNDALHDASTSKQPEKYAGASLKHNKLCEGVTDPNPTRDRTFILEGDSEESQRNDFGDTLLISNLLTMEFG